MLVNLLSAFDIELNLKYSHGQVLYWSHSEDCKNFSGRITLQDFVKFTPVCIGHSTRRIENLCDSLVNIVSIIVDLRVMFGNLKMNRIQLTELSVAVMKYSAWTNEKQPESANSLP